MIAFLCMVPAAMVQAAVDGVSTELDDGEYRIEVSLEGGSGRASVASPAVMVVKDGKAYAQIEWKSSYYDYMIIEDEKLFPINTDGNSIFEIPILTMDSPMEVIADTTAMSVPHEISYTLTFDSDSVTVDNVEVTERDNTLLQDTSTAKNTEAAEYNDAALLWDSSAFNNAGIEEHNYTTLSLSKMWIIVIGVVIIVLACMIALVIKKKSKCGFVLAVFFCIGLGICVIMKNKNIKEENLQTPDILGSSLTWEYSLTLDYATGFAVDYYTSDALQGEYKLITIKQEGQYLVMPENGTVPEDLPQNVIVILPPHQIYLAASQVMDMFASIDALDSLQFSSLDKEEWYIDAAKEQMEQGNLLYAGKYSAPDYELILEQGCDLTIENTMIYHSPEVKEKLESFEIPVMVDYSSYEAEPLGRTEWVKLYGALTGHEEEAEAAFQEQVEEYTNIVLDENMNSVPTVAFFYISANGDVKVRKSGDYMSKMITAAGGTYIFTDLGGEDENASTTVSMQMEEFYAAAKEADYIIYNSTIEGELESVDAFLEKSELLSNMKAVKEEHVYCTAQNLYQSTMEIGTITADIHKMLIGDEDMLYLHHLK